MLAELDGEVSKIKRDAKMRGMRKDRVQELVDEKIKQADEAEKSRPKRGAMDLRGDDDGEEMEIDGGMGDTRTRSGRLSKMRGLGRNG